MDDQGWLTNDKEYPSMTTVIHQPVLHHHQMLHFYFMNKFCNTQPTLLK